MRKEKREKKYKSKFIRPALRNYTYKRLNKYRENSHETIDYLINKVLDKLKMREE